MKQLRRIDNVAYVRFASVYRSFEDVSDFQDLLNEVKSKKKINRFILTSMNRLNCVFMDRAFELAKKGLNTTMPNPRVGCVIVKDGKIVGEGYHRWLVKTMQK